MHRIKVCSIPEIFCIVYRQKGIVTKKLTLGMFLYQDETFGELTRVAYVMACAYS